MVFGWTLHTRIGSHAEFGYASYGDLPLGLLEMTPPQEGSAADFLEVMAGSNSELLISLCFR
jgi:hypothetical protein